LNSEPRNNELSDPRYEGKTLNEPCPTLTTKKFIKNCPCADCLQYKKSTKNIEKNTKTPLLSSSELPDPEQLQEPIQSSNSRVRYLILSIFIISLGYAINHFRPAPTNTNDNDVSSSNSRPTASSPPPDPSKEDIVRSLLHRTSLEVNVERSDIPAQLPRLLEDFGRVFSAPANYDPNKQNIFLIPQKHFRAMLVNEVPTDQGIFDIQANIVRICHVLYALGVRRQFLEGIGQTVDLTHDGTFPELGERPLTALPLYRQNGRIRRAYIAIEAIYGSDLESLGTENTDQMLAYRRAGRYADNVLFPEARTQIVMGIAQHLGIDVGRPRRVERAELDAFVSLIRENTLNMTPDQIEAINQRFVMSNPNYRAFLNSFVEVETFKYQVRDTQFANAIKNPTHSPQQDTWMIVGSTHIKGIRAAIQDRNVFVLAPSGDDEQMNSMITNGSGTETPEDHKRALIRYDAYLFGLEQTKGSRY
jgi:hypothetical protein